jgi:hypothetical protein
VTRYKQIAVGLLAVVFLVGCGQGSDREDTVSASGGPTPVLRVGAASAPVNPDNGTFLAGYGQNRRSTGVHDNLYAKAVVFDDGTTAVALLVVDSIGIQYDTAREIRAAASARATAVTLPPEQIVVASTHTHCSPDVIGIYGPDQTKTGRDEDYLRHLVDTSAATVAKAAVGLEPARLVTSETECVGWAVNDSEPDELDNSVTVLQCIGDSGEPIVTLTGFACHPTVLDGDTTLVSSDWVGAFYEEMKANTPGEHVFVQGGVGGWIQPKTPERTFALADSYGNDLAAKVVAALEQATPVKGRSVRFARKVFAMRNDNELFRQISAAGLNLIPREFADGVETEVAWFAVGDAQFATHPGETAPTFTWDTEALMDTGPKFVVGLGLDQLGYIVKPEWFDSPDIPFAPYQTSMSLGRQTGPNMMAALESIIP